MSIEPGGLYCLGCGELLDDPDSDYCAVCEEEEEEDWDLDASDIEDSDLDDDDEEWD